MKRSLRSLFVLLLVCLSLVPVVSASAWLSPTGDDNPAGWTDESNIYDENTGTCGECTSISADSWGAFIVLTHSGLISSKLRFWADYWVGGIDAIDVDVYKDGEWVHVYQGVFADMQYVEKTFAQGSVTQSRVRFYNNQATPLSADFYEFDFWGYVGWGSGDIEGDWNVCERTEWSALLGQDSGLASWNSTVYDFTGYYAKFTMSNMSAWRDWWWVRGEKRFGVQLNFSGADNDVNVLLLWSRCEESFGFIHDWWFMVGVGLNNTYFDPFWWTPFGIEMSRDEWSPFPWDYQELFVYLDGNDLHIEVINYREDIASHVDMWTQIIDVGASWNDVVVIEQNLFHVGSGYFGGSMADVIYDTDPYSPSVPDVDAIEGYTIYDFWDDLVGVVQSALPSWLNEQIGQFAGWSALLMSFLIPLWSLVVQLLPIAPFFLGFYVLDSIATSVEQRSFAPVGVCFMALWNGAVGIISTIVSIAHAIYDFIHFW